MTNKELAQRVREVLTQRGWQPRAGYTYKGEPACLLQAASEALYRGEPQPTTLLRDRLDEFVQALGFPSRVDAVEWNDAQTDVQAIFERLERVT